MSLPVVAIVGRPNVGKSSLLNMLAGRRISIVDPTAGVTRDRISTIITEEDTYFELVDTGGFGIVDRDDLNEHVEQQIRFAVDQASLILFVVDARDGILPLDQTVATWLRSCQRPVILLANKVDAPEMVTELHEFHRLGFGTPMVVSAMQNRGKEELRRRIVKALAETPFDVPVDPVLQLAIVGRQNSGKSTLINSLAGQERVIVSEVAGTTRDAIDVRFEMDGRTLVAIDTAGVRKKARIDDDIEYYSYHRAELSIRRADVVLLMLDATREVGGVDKRLARYVIDQYKPCIIVINKWDLAKDQASTEQYGEYLLEVLPALDYAPVAFVTAKDGKNLQSVIDLAQNLFKQAQSRVGTGELNKFIAEITSQNVPRPKRGIGQVKILYATQISTCPPTIALFVNHRERVTPTYERFVLRRMRDLLPFPEVPIRLLFRSRRGAASARESTGGRTGGPS